MGWFDSEESGDRQNPAAPARAPQRAQAPPPPPAPASEGGGSTLGKQIHIDGTIVCGEDLTILGKVEGTIHAKGTLVIAKEADVRATIDGHRVMVHGKVEGNVQGAEKVVVGATGTLNGNIEAPALEIAEGAFFKGNVEMSRRTAAKAPAAPKKEASRESGSGESKSSATEESRTPGKPAGSQSGSGGGRQGETGKSISV